MLAAGRGRPVVGVPRLSLQANAVERIGRAMPKPNLTDPRRVRENIAEQEHAWLRGQMRESAKQ